MKPISRREAGKLIAIGSAGLLVSGRSLAGAERIDSVVRGVALGSQSYSFRDRDLDACIEGFRAVGLGECELWDAHTVPHRPRGAELTKWRLETPLSHFENVRRKLEDAGIHIHALTYNLRAEMSDAEIERGFEIARALGVNIITSSANVSSAPRAEGNPDGVYAHEGRRLPHQWEHIADSPGLRLAAPAGTRPGTIFCAVSRDQTQLWLTATALDTAVSRKAILLRSSGGGGRAVWHLRLDPPSASPAGKTRATTPSSGKNR